MPAAGVPADDGTVDDGTVDDGPTRRCIVTGEVMPKSGLIRFVVGPDGTVVPDLKERLPGRGLWVRADAATIARAAGRGVFARAAKRSVVVPAGLAEVVAALARRQAGDLIGIARRAGQAVAGYEKVRAWIAEGRAALVVEALDGAEDGKRKLRSAVSAARRSGPGPVVREALDMDTLGRIFGRDQVVHVAIAAGGTARRLSVELDRLDRLRIDGGAIMPRGRAGNEDGPPQGGAP